MIPDYVPKGAELVIEHSRLYINAQFLFSMHMNSHLYCQGRLHAFQVF